MKPGIVRIILTGALLSGAGLVAGGMAVKALEAVYGPTVSAGLLWVGAAILGVQLAAFRILSRVGETAQPARPSAPLARDGASRHAARERVGQPAERIPAL